MLGYLFFYPNAGVVPIFDPCQIITPLVQIATWLPNPNPSPTPNPKPTNTSLCLSWPVFQVIFNLQPILSQQYNNF